MANKYLVPLKKYIPNVADEKLTRALGVGFSMALLVAADKRVTKEEVSYMRREIKSHVGCSEEHLHILVDFCLYQVVKKGFRQSELNEFLPFLNAEMDILQKQDFITSLFILSRSDLEMSRKEDRFIESIVKAIELEQSMADLLRNTQEMILNSKLGNTTDEYEIVHGADKFES